MEAGFGKAPVFIGTGGSIGPVASFDRVLGMPQVLIGVGLPDDHIHAPNEKFNLSQFFGGIQHDGVPVRRVGGTAFVIPIPWALTVMQLIPSPPPQPMGPTPIPAGPSPSPTPFSERGLLSSGLDALAARVKAQTGGTLGAVVWDLHNGINVQCNAQLAFPMASVQKLPLAVLTYAAIDSGEFQASQTIAIEPADVVTTVSPIAQEYAKGRRAYTLRELVARMLQDSDNTAADAIYRVLGGAQAINTSLTAMGFDGFAYRTDEAGLSADAAAGRTFARGGDNAGSPAAIAQMLGDLAQGKILSQTSRAELRGMLAAVNTFPDRLRAGFGAGTSVEHKTGTSITAGGVTDATNDVGIVNANGRTLVVVAMLHGAKGSDKQRDSLIAAVAQIANDATRLFPTQ